MSKTTLSFFAQHNRGSNIFRADPCYEKNNPWYDWVTVTWQNDGNIPAKLLLFWEIDEKSYKKSFTVGSTTISGPGTYAIAYSLLSEESIIKAHGVSLLVQYAQLDLSRDICMFPVDSIHSPITAVPYNINQNIIEATEWIILANKLNWKSIFGVGLLGGIGFTMSIFITLLAFDHETIINNSKLVILISSLISGLLGFLMLNFTLNKSYSENE